MRGATRSRSHQGNDQGPMTQGPINPQCPMLTAGDRAIDHISGPRLSEPQHAGTVMRFSRRWMLLLTRRAAARRAAGRQRQFAHSREARYHGKVRPPLLGAASALAQAAAKTWLIQVEVARHQN